MKYEDKADSCQWCKKEMDSGTNGERPKLYCSDACRYRYHNAQKKLKREDANAWRAIAYIQRMMLKSGELQEDAIRYTRHLIVHTKTLNFDCSCRNCGQYRFFMPMRGEKCDFCQAEDWRYFEKKIGNLSEDLHESKE